jgi:lysozyme family protein
MADKSKCVVPVLNNEDRGGSGVVTNYGGRRTRFGIDEKFNPDMPESFWTEPAPAAKAEAETRLTDAYWKFDGLESNRVACKVFDVCVNTGESEGVVIFQRAINAVQAANARKQVAEDGQYGKATEDAANSCDVDTLVARICDFQKAFYDHLCAVAPTQAHLSQLTGWYNRARFIPDASLDNLPPAAVVAAAAVPASITATT